MSYIISYRSYLPSPCCEYKVLMRYAFQVVFLLTPAYIQL